MNSELIERLRAARGTVTTALLEELSPEGHWLGMLSSSALATSTAVTALATVDRVTHAELIKRGLQWLATNANPDGGWGDTISSRSNLSTTALAWAAFGAAQADESYSAPVAGAVGYLTRHAGSVEGLVPAIEAKYGRDRTFSVPITMTLALSGRLGRNGWQRVRPLPFELAALPRRMFGVLRLPVVSYALPALIAIGQVIHHHAPRHNPLRHLARQRTLDLLATLQPPNGGFLEATPLTSFVTMSLAGMDLSDHTVAQRGAAFLRASVRSDGSWPIDTNLATWVTTQSIKALRHQPGILLPQQQSAIRTWLLAQQYRAAHPYTGADPGGWAWTNLPGGVPDADDTAGAILALHALNNEESKEAVQKAIGTGLRWLLDLQNRDGGVPTFCRGWGTLPFDRSTPELTAHALDAWSLCEMYLDPAERTRAAKAKARALQFLAASQRHDGAWIPLWFGNEHAPHQENPVYGTARVLLHLSPDKRAIPIYQRAREFILSSQNPDGGWGGALGSPSTLEETALALGAVAASAVPTPALISGANWLVSAIEKRAWCSPAPIGLYFARLWYFERLYPLIFAVDTLGQILANNAPTTNRPERDMDATRLNAQTARLAELRQKILIGPWFGPQTISREKA